MQWDSEIDLGSMCLFRLEYALKSEDQGHRLQRVERIYGLYSSESAMWTRQCGHRPRNLWHMDEHMSHK